MDTYTSIYQSEFIVAVWIFQRRARKCYKTGPLLYSAENRKDGKLGHNKTMRTILNDAFNYVLGYWHSVVNVRPCTSIIVTL